MFSLIAGWTATDVCAGPFSYSPVQSPARPFGLKIVDKVALGGSDERSKDFLVNELPTMGRVADEGFKREGDNDDGKGKSGGKTDSGLTKVDPSSLKLAVVGTAAWLARRRRHADAVSAQTAC